MRLLIYGNKRIKKSVCRNSLMSAIMIAYNILCVILQQILQGNILYGNVLVSIIIVLVIIFSINNGKITLSVKLMGLCAYTMLAMIISWLFINSKTEYITAFMFYGLVGCYIGMQEVNTELVLRYLIYISFLPLCFINNLMEAHYREGLNSASLDMGISYAMMPLIFAALLHIIFYRKTSNIVIKIGYIVNTIFMIMLIARGTRGFILGLLILVILVIMNKYSKKQNNIEQPHKKVRVAFLWFCVCFGLILIMYFDNIILLVSQYFSSLGIHINIFDKTERLIKRNAEGTNGRIEIWKLAVEGIIKSPIWGHGWGIFERTTGQVYPHNIILELMYEGGILLTIPIILPLISGVYKCLAGGIRDINDYVYVILLISLCLPRLMVSASLWNIQIFWMMLAFMMSRISNEIVLLRLI